MDDRAGSPGGSHHCRSEDVEIPKSLDKQQSPNASAEGHGVWMHQRHTLGTFASRRQVRCRASCPDDSRPYKPIQPLAILDDSSRPPFTCPFAVVLPPPWSETLFYKHIIPICFLRIQYHCYLRRPHLFSSNF